jgi:hypothetical protein
MYVHPEKSRSHAEKKIDNFELSISHGKAIIFEDRIQMK